MKIFLAYIVLMFLYVFSTYGIAKVETVSCSVAMEYEQALLSKINVIEKSYSLLKRLSKRDKLPKKVIQESVFTFDIMDENVVKQKLQQFSEVDEENSFEIKRPFELSDECLIEFPKIVERELQLLSLKNVVLKLKIDFLSLDAETRNALLVTEDSEGEFESKANQIEAKIEVTEKTKKAIASAKAKAEEMQQVAVSLNEQKFAEAILEHEAYRQKIADISVSHLNEIKTILSKYEVISQRLKDFEDKLRNVNMLSVDALTEFYMEISDTWRTLIDDGFSVYRMLASPKVVGVLPQFSKDKREGFSSEQILELQRTRQTAENEREALVKSQRDMVSENFNDFYDPLLRSSILRSKVLTTINSRDVSLIEVNDEYFEDIVREVMAIPFRFFGITYIKYVEIKSSSEKGLRGLWEIFQNFLGMILILFIPFLAGFLSRKLQYYLDSYRSNILRKRRRTDQMSLYLAIWIQRITPYTP